MKVSIVIFLLISILIGISISTNPVNFGITKINSQSFLEPIYSNVTDLVFIIDDGYLKKSVDGGMNWIEAKDVNGKPIQALYQYTQSKFSNILILSISEFQKNVFSISRDGGETFISSEIINYELIVSSIKAHPNINGLLLARSDQYIFTSNDFGLTWNNASKKTGLTLSKTFHNQYTDPVWDQSKFLPSFYAVLTNNNGVSVLCVSKDLGDSFVTLFERAIGFTSTENYIYVVAQTFGSQEELYTKTLTGGYAFKYCYLPFVTTSKLPELIIIDDSTDVILIGVGGEYFGSVYVSNSRGNEFSIYLNYVSMVNGQFEFSVIRGANSSYLFNGVTNKYGIGPSSPPIVRSFITNNHGNNWSSMVPPYDMKCNIKPCRLNVYGISNIYGSLYSNVNAPGLLLSTGNSNPALSSNATTDRIKTVLSVDGGKTWKKLFNTSTIYEVGSFGKTILFANNLESTNVIYYTLDQGITTLSFTLPDNYKIKQIITNPKNENNKFIMNVKDLNGSSYIIGVDITQI